MKTPRMVLSLLAILSVLLVSCQPQMNVAEVKRQIEEANARQMKAFEAKDPTAAAANYAPDAAVLAPNSKMIIGKEGIEAMFKEMLPGTTEFKFSSKAFDASGDLAFEYGTYTGIFDMGMGAMKDEGKYLTVWKKQADGKWMIVADVFNTDMPLPPPPPPPADVKKKK